MRFGVMIAAAAAMLCAGQASAARYYQFIVTGTTPVTYYDPMGLSAPQGVQYTSTVTAFFDTQVTTPGGLAAQGDSLYINYSPYSGYLGTLKSGTDGTTFNLYVDPAALTGTLQSLAAVGSYGFTTCTRYGCNIVNPGTLLSVMGRTFDAPGITPLVGETITSAAIAVPELASWAMMIIGIGAVGCAARRSRPARQMLASS